MRLKHRPWGDTFIEEHPELIITKDRVENSNFNEFISRDPLELEIGIGRGDFILQKSLNNPAINYLGVEKAFMAAAISGKKVIDYKLNNLLIVSMDINYLFDKLKNESLNNIYLNFSDPWPKKRQHKRRLTYPTILEQYYSLLKIGGRIYFKTDNDDLFADSINYFNSSKFKVESIDYDYNLQDGDCLTEYEQKFRLQGVKIKRLVAIKE